jgi:hypothetical protein
VSLRYGLIVIETKESVPSEKTTTALATFAASAAKKSCHTEFYWLVVGNWQVRVRIQ